MAPGLPAAAIQNTVIETALAHSRLADVLSQGMHDGLVQVLDDAVVRAVDMDADLGGGPGGACLRSR